MKPGTRPERVGLSEATLSKETSFKGRTLQAVVDSWCKIQVIHDYLKRGCSDKNCIKIFGANFQCLN